MKNEEEKEEIKMHKKAAIVYMDAQMFKEAITEFEKALELDPNNTVMLSDLASCYIRTGRLDIAYKIYTKAIVINHKHPDLLANRAEVLRASGHIEAALVECAIALAIDPKSKIAHFCLLSMLIRSDKKTKAQMVYNNLEDNLKEMGTYEESLDFLNDFKLMIAAIEEK